MKAYVRTHKGGHLMNIEANAGVATLYDTDGVATITTGIFNNDEAAIDNLCRFFHLDREGAC